MLFFFYTYYKFITFGVVLKKNIKNENNEMLKSRSSGNLTSVM